MARTLGGVGGRRRASVAVAFALAAGCGGGRGTPAGPTAAVVTASLSPDVLVVRPCAGCGPLVGELEIAATLTLRESAGVAATVESVGVLLRSDGGVVIGQGEFDAASVTQLAGSTRLSAGGTLAIPVGVHFPPSASRFPGTFTATPVVRDERGNRVTLTASRPVPGM